MSSLPISRIVYHASETTFYGIPISLATRAGEPDPSAVSANSIRQALGSDCTESVLMFLERNTWSGSVVVRGREQSAPLVSLETFFNFCMQHKMPRLDDFRAHLSRVAVNVQVRGGHIEPGAGPKAYLPESLKDNPIANLAAMIISQQDQIDQVGRRIGSVESKADAALALYHGESDEYALKGWCKMHGRSHPETVLSRLGGRLSGECRRRGIKPSSVNDRKWGRVNVYPRNILEELVPEGTPVSWMVV